MTGDIDSTIPAGITHLIERESSLFHQHGGVATEVVFDSLEEMSLDDFIEKVVPTLKERKDMLTILKDTTREQLVRILADNVAMYHITGIQDVFYDAMLERLLSDQQVTITPNLQYPLIMWRVEQSGEKVIVVEVPETQFEMQHDSWPKERFLIWHPRLWLKMRLTVQNVPCAWRIRAMPVHPNDLEKEKVCGLPFPNVFDSGDICWGSTHFTRSGDTALSVNDAVCLTLNRFFGSSFNYDLIDRQDTLNMANLYKALPTVEKYAKMLKDLDSSGSKAHIVRLFRCFQEKENLLRFKYHPMETAKSFLEGCI